MTTRHPMRTRDLIATALFVLCPLSAGSQPAGEAAARDALLQTDRDWSQAASTRDVERIVAYWTDDAVIDPPGQARVEGKAAIRQYVADSLKIPGFAIAWTPLRAEVSRSGDLGYTTGTNAVTLPTAGGGTTTLAGRYVTVWKKAADGKWRCVVDSWNAAPEPPK